MARAVFLVASIALIIVVYQACGKLGNNGTLYSSNSSVISSPGSPTPSPTPSTQPTTPPSLGPTQLIQYQDASLSAQSETISVKNLSPMQIGDLIVVLIQDANISLLSKTQGTVGCPCVPTDTSGNTYISVPGTNFFYAINTVAAAAGANTITANFSSNTGPSEILFYEFNGIETNSPLDSFAVDTTASTSFSASITTTNANDLILGQIDSTGACTSWTNGWSMQMTDHANCWATFNAASSGTYTAAGISSGTDTIQLVAFKKVAATKPQFVLQQINEKAISTAGTTIAVEMRSDQLAGDLNIVVVTWDAGSTTTISGPGTTPHYITDTKGNVYTLVGTVAGTGVTQAIWYSQNILAATGGSNTISVNFSSAITAQMTVSEYSGSITGASSPLDQANGNANTGALATTGSVTTKYPNELIITTIAEGMGQDVTGSGPGFRILSVPNVATVPGVPWYSTADTFSATMGTFSNFFNLSSSKSWVATVVTFH